MRAVAMFPVEKKVRLVDRPAPKLERDDEVRLRMLEVGVCGTDHEIARFEYGTPPAGEPYLVMGHESLGEVVEVGPAVSGIKPGTSSSPPCAALAASPSAAPASTIGPTTAKPGRTRSAASRGATAS